MMHFESYRWEDHVPPKGGWRLNLAVAALAFALIAAALPDSPDNSGATTWASAEPATTVDLSGLGVPARVTPAAFTGAAGEPALCPDTYADS
jgi:hypothetical protein